MQSTENGVFLASLDGTNGEWQLATDPHNVGREQEWWGAPRTESKPTRVPWIIQDAFPEYHGVAWYWRNFECPSGASTFGRALLQFEAVDYLCQVWLNGIFVGEHEGGETPFTLDVTDAIERGESNRLAVRVLNPTNQPIDGIALLETPRRCKFIPYAAGAAFNHGGITGSVQLLLVPTVRVEDLSVLADAHNGAIHIKANVRNAHEHGTEGHLEFCVAPAMSGETLVRQQVRCALAPGDTLVEASINLDTPRLWQLNEPFLYRVSARLQTEVANGEVGALDERSTRIGFRDFRFENGYFRLNGKRLFLRSTHTLNHTPVGLQVPHDPDLLRRDLINFKVMGFNMVRFIWGGTLPYQLDLCDEIGLLVYNESYAAYPFAETPYMKERFDRSISEVIRRDRNHPSIVIWGLLNEVHDNALFEHAAQSLPLVRALDPSRMVMINSGRWDKRIELGSFSNPESLTWDVMLGREGEATPTLDGVAPDSLLPIMPETPAAHGDNVLDEEQAPDDAQKSLLTNLTHGHEQQAVSAEGGFATDWAAIPGYVMDMGDVHPYPRVPQLPVATELLRHLGRKGNPVYLSEYGIGSAVDLWRVTRHYECMGATHAEDATFYRDKLDRYLHDYSQWKMDELFVGPQEFFKCSLAKMAGQRTLGLNAIRSNPHLVGYNLTGAIDHVMCGEGLTTLFRELKPGTVDAVFEGFAPLRLCLFTEPPHIYRGASLQLEAVLANEDALSSGQYSILLQVIGPNLERVFERTVNVSVPESQSGNEAPLAIPFFDEHVKIEGPEGKYRFIATFPEGAAPTGGETEFYVSDAAQMPAIESEVTLWGEDAELSAWLSAHGIRSRPFSNEGSTAENASEAKVFLVSSTPPSGGVNAFRDLVRRVARGATAIFLSPEVFARGSDPVGWLPLEQRGELGHIGGWLYLKDEWAKRHPIFDGLPAGGLMDYTFYREVIPDAVWKKQEVPSQAVAGAIKASQDYDSGLMLSVYELGAGRIILNTLRIRETLGCHPTAERLLCNLLLFAARTEAQPNALSNSEVEELVSRLYRPYPFSEFKRQWQIAVASPDEPSISEIELPQDSLVWSEFSQANILVPNLVNFHSIYGNQGGLVYARGEIDVPIAMSLQLMLGLDGPCKVWIGKELVATVEHAHNPATPDEQGFSITLEAGRHTVTVAFLRRGGQGWGFFLRFKRVDERYSDEELRSATALLPIVDP